MLLVYLVTKKMIYNIILMEKNNLFTLKRRILFFKRLFTFNIEQLKYFFLYLYFITINISISIENIFLQNK